MRVKAVVAETKLDALSRLDRLLDLEPNDDGGKERRSASSTIGPPVSVVVCHGARHGHSY
jgi:hypothetical protein